MSTLYGCILVFSGHIHIYIQAAPKKRQPWDHLLQRSSITIPLAYDDIYLLPDLRHNHLFDIHPISNAYPTACARDTIASNAGFELMSRIEPRPELHQNLVRDRIISFSCFWADVGELMTWAILATCWTLHA